MLSKVEFEFVNGFCGEWTVVAGASLFLSGALMGFKGFFGGGVRFLGF